MPGSIPSCFLGGAPPETTAAGPTLTTSIYDTPLGLAALSWSRTLLGLSLRIDLHLHDSDDPLTVSVRPWLLWRRRGRRRFSLPSPHPQPHHLLLSWDLSRARFAPSGGPEPSSSFSLSISLDSHPLLLLGDLHHPPPLISRRDHAVLSDAKPYSTTARFASKDHEISISIGGKDKGMSFELDGERLLHVRRIRWKFRGSERVDLGDGYRIRVSWDLHRWFFDSGSETDEAGRAVFLIRFEGGSDREGHSGKGFPEVLWETEGHLGKVLNWSDNSSVGGGGENGKSGSKSKKKKKKMMKSLLTTSSSSSSSSASSASGSSAVMDWASAEEAQLTGVQGFSLLVYARKC